MKLSSRIPQGMTGEPTSLCEFAKAFSAAQGVLRAASKDRDNPFFKSSYATLASVIEAIRGPFADNGLCFLQPTRVEPDGTGGFSVTVETIILHTSGGWISGEATAKPVKTDPQGVGSLISYMRRYGLQAMVGIASADDDAEAAQGRGQGGAETPRAASSQPPAAAQVNAKPATKKPSGW